MIARLIAIELGIREHHPILCRSLRATVSNGEHRVAIPAALGKRVAVGDQ